MNETLQQINEFINAQRAEWPVAAKGFSGLDGVVVKDFTLNGFPVKVQFNPARAVSSGAKVDKKTIAARPCFLCLKNRDEKQRNIEWKDGKYEVLINPFPIFPRHLTIPSTLHERQEIKGRIADMFDLALELPTFTVFYNGPRCGASAPDHMHFQAGDSSFLPIWQWVDAGKFEEIKKVDGATLKVSENLPMKLYVIEASTAAGADELFNALYQSMPVPEGEWEPMMNVLAKGDDGKVTIAVIPRGKHRPSFYDAEGEEGMMISPASVDLGGVFILPREIDFNRIDEDTLQKVIDEVTAK